MTRRIMKIISLVVLIFSIISMMGCQKNDLSKKAVEQGKLAMAEHEYNKALSSFELAIDEGLDDDEIVKIMDIIKFYNETKNLIDEEKIDEAEKVLNGIDEDYKKYAIKGDIDALKDSVSSLKEEIDKEETSEKKKVLSVEEASNEYINLSDDEHRKINIFFSNFSEAYMTEFDIDNYNLGELINFAYVHNTINNYNLIGVDGYEMYIDKSHVEKTINKYFGLNISHGNVGGFQYRNGKYYTQAASGENYSFFSHVDALKDNKDGTYSAEISIYSDNNYDGVNSVYYNSKKTWENIQNSYEYLGKAEAKAKPEVVDGKNTYQLLYYKVQNY